MKNSVKFAVALLATALTTCSASARVWEFSFTDNAGDSASGLLTTNASDVVTAISGSFDSYAITGLTGYASADQQLYPTVSPYADFSGISFTAINGVSYNWSNYPGVTGGIANSLSDPGGYGAYNTHFTSVSVSAVPEVSTWAMMLAGFACLGFVGYRRNKAAALAA